jgi:hypothetical protein
VSRLIIAVIRQTPNTVIFSRGANERLHDQRGTPFFPTAPLSRRPTHFFIFFTRQIIGPINSILNQLTLQYRSSIANCGLSLSSDPVASIYSAHKIIKNGQCSCEESCSSTSGCIQYLQTRTPRYKSCLYLLSYCTKLGYLDDTSHVYDGSVLDHVLFLLSWNTFGS